jgi:hypothetical protein
MKHEAVAIKWFWQNDFRERWLRVDGLQRGATREAKNGEPGEQQESKFTKSFHQVLPEDSLALSF